MYVIHFEDDSGALQSETYGTYPEALAARQELMEWARSVGPIQVYIPLHTVDYWGTNARGMAI